MVVHGRKTFCYCFCLPILARYSWVQLSHVLQTFLGALCTSFTLLFGIWLINLISENFAVLFLKKLNASVSNWQNQLLELTQFSM